ncbi:GNAT family N-acetyltransferase [Bradyrhizobium erythrophlei]|jgi:CelD/BcsL family acetyltransferase involved in cellulose biosynthesis|uniref:Acetyltransferase involved in cellulose biosynthesis, CelD/BcsL family n=1 Tax=Bradyrhizobium erythrophlei TaxID=1437360 RepID=A0A1M7TD28_9BRAD|nr:GNAT family N-acetyltransferase [Bradyrhizobium erythrophlei]SHN68586.1 Acetyltransferase involved in cellulose biosynthesis, CelD/BcsL family [Bradyrhizobium erythrophlei]
MTVVEAEQTVARASSPPARFKIDFVDDWKQAAACWSADGQETAFQHPLWFDAWYSAFANVSPLIAIVSDATTGRKVALVPMIRHVRRGVRIVEFADLNVTDYNAPLLRAGVAFDISEARAIAKALVAELRKVPGGADLVRMRKMPGKIAGVINPLALLGREGSSSLNGNIIETGDDFEVYRTSIKRIQMPRYWRVFNRNPGAAFRMIESVDAALKTVDVMDAQQRARMQKLGLKFVLNDGVHGGFYRDLVRRGLPKGYVVVSELTCDEGVVATMLGVRHGDYFAVLRISNAGARWSHCSPSKLVVERTMAALHEMGVRRFDLSVGNYAFKRRFGATQIPLTDASIALGWRGVPYVLRDHTAQGLRRYPWLSHLVERVLGRPSHEE